MREREWEETQSEPSTCAAPAGQVRTGARTWRQLTWFSGRGRRAGSYVGGRWRGGRGRLLLTPCGCPPGRVGLRSAAGRSCGRPPARIPVPGVCWTRRCGRFSGCITVQGKPAAGPMRTFTFGLRHRASAGLLLLSTRKLNRNLLSSIFQRKRICSYKFTFSYSFSCPQSRYIFNLTCIYIHLTYFIF